MLGLKSKTKTLTDPKQIGELLTRGVEKIFPNREFLEKQLLSGRQLTLYLGIDPTGPTLHMGHVIPLLKLRQFQDLGHQVILLIGDFTATIGDPTDKLAARVPLTIKQVLVNAKHYKKQASAILKFNGNNSARLEYNSKWLGKLSMGEITELLSHVTYAQTIKRDMFQERIKEGRDLYVNEFLYPVLQGYDSVAMGVDGEVGGNDQTFNMLMGRDLLKRLKNKEKFVLAMKLLSDPGGKKMGKTEGNIIALSDSPEEMFGKIMSWPDELIIPGLELCTRVAMVKITEFKNQMASGGNPKDCKMFLAQEIVRMYHGDKAAQSAQENFTKTFSGGGVSENVTDVRAPSGTSLVEVLLKEKMVASKTEWRRLVSEGAVSITSTGEKINDPDYKLKQEQTFRIGKKRFIKITTGN